MFSDLPACAGILAAARGAGRRAGPGVLAALAHGWAEVAIERERRATLAMVVACLPAGWCVSERDACGRERFTGPACAAPSRAVRAALR